jgi:predicted dinucleotide-binding enzyme
MMGSRDPKNPKATTWARRVGKGAKSGTFADTASFGEVLFNCTHGANSLEALRAAGKNNLADKVLVDIANILPLDVHGPESLGEQIQKVFPQTRVVKALNTINCEVMVDPSRVPGLQMQFMSGNDAVAKKAVRELVESFGWKDIIDLGDIGNARATEELFAALGCLMEDPGNAAFQHQCRAIVSTRGLSV